MNAKRWTCVALATAFVIGTAQATTYTWTQTAGGSQSWNTGANWGGTAPDPVSGDTVDFSTVNIGANTTLLLEAPRTAEIWKFGDTNNGQDWVVTNNTMILAGTTPVINVSNRTTTLNCILNGTAGLKKTGAGTLTLNNTFVNTFTGPIVLDGGALWNVTANTIGSSDSLTFTGAASIRPYSTFGGPSLYYNKPVTINDGVTATMHLVSQFYHMYFGGVLAGSGTLYVQGDAGGAGGSVSFTNEVNTFTGPIQFNVAGNTAVTLNVNSLPDVAQPIKFGGTKTTVQGGSFNLGAGVATPLVFNNRWFEMGGSTPGGLINNNNANTANTITINTDMNITSTNSKTLTLGGSNTGNNTFAGAITNGANAVISLVKEGNGKWILSGDNTFSGTTTVTAGTLVLAGGQCLSDTNLLSIASGKVVQLETGVKEKVGGLVLGTVTNNTPAIWGAIGNSQAQTNSASLLGTGLLYVNTDLPASGTRLYLK